MEPVCDGSDLSQIDLAVLMIDGIVFAECCCVVALATAPSLAPTSLATGFFVRTWDCRFVGRAERSRIFRPAPFRAL